MILTPADIQALTGKVQAPAQCRALARMGVGYVQRPDGTPVVTWASVDRALAGQAAVMEPRWEMVR